MKVNTSYRQIWAIAAPIMLGSAAQNIVALSDSLLLSHYGAKEFAAIGIVGVFYLVIAAIGYGFSKGGQIMIARRMGEGNPEEVGRTFYAMLYFELALATMMFLLLRYGCPFIFKYFIKSPDIYRLSIDFIRYRALGIFFSYAGVAIVALYTGVARTKFITFDTILLGITNLTLCFGLIYGKWGLPEMGIAGAGLASSIAEMVAFTAFVIYLFWDKKNRAYHLFQPRKVDLVLIKQQFALGAPVVAQAVVGLGSWFVFFSFIEKLGERELAITNLVRIVYLCLSIPCWGFASGVNTLVSNFIGQERQEDVMPIILKTASLCLFITLCLSIPVLAFPEYLVAPLIGVEEKALIPVAQPIFQILLIILIVFSFSGVYFNGLAGTGATFAGLKMQTICAIFYVAYVYVVINHTNGGLTWAWSAEIFYWLLLMAFTFIYLRSKEWHYLKV